MTNQPYIILVNPQLAENVGMAARAMMNCGLYNLRLVNPRENHLSEKAVAASSNAEEILHKAEIFDSLSNAIKDLHQVFASTARRRDMIKTIYTADAAVEKIYENLSCGIKCGILFGPERTGLENDDVAIADAVIEIPLNPKHCSLNLSQAVLLVGYEWHKLQANAPKSQLVTNKTNVADKETVANMFNFLEKELDECGNFRVDEKRPRMVRNLRNIFLRSQLTEQEINTLYGVFNHLINKK
ncbi:MAG: RNA methyltransferase [Lactobacillaceae bacterium]|jgi:tRNA/rRNA methyltransferase|nr:RNA methyltransferase [Lactobacillaceae bacterium]